MPCEAGRLAKRSASGKRCGACFPRFFHSPKNAKSRWNSSGFAKVNSKANSRRIPVRLQTAFPIRAAIAVGMVAAAEVIHAALHHAVHAAFHEPVVRAVFAAAERAAVAGQ